MMREALYASFLVRMHTHRSLFLSRGEAPRRNYYDPKPLSKMDLDQLTKRGLTQRTEETGERIAGVGYQP
jgi:hypothetical protein